jgi:hypothetical protein
MVFEMPDEVPEAPKAAPAEMKPMPRKRPATTYCRFSNHAVFERKSESCESDRPKFLKF